jgi:hypothetical protein
MKSTEEDFFAMMERERSLNIFVRTLIRAIVKQVEEF